ncbi:IS3 family transposase [Oceanisphaera sp. KMM 10153]
MLKTEPIYHEVFRTQEEAKRTIFEYMKCFITGCGCIPATTI